MGSEQPKSLKMKMIEWHGLRSQIHIVPRLVTPLS